MNNESVLLTIVKIFLMIIFPPIGVFFYVGFTMHFWINLVLTIFGYIPGLIHAIYIAASPNLHQKPRL